MRCEPETYIRNLLWYLDDLDKLIDERVLKYGELRMKEREVQAIKEIKKWLKEREIQEQESLVTEGITLEANLSTDGTSLDASSVTEGTTLEACLVTKGASFSSGIDSDVEKILVDTVASDIENAAIKPSYDNDTVSEILSNKNDEAKIKFDTEDVETTNIELEYNVTSLLKEYEHLKAIYQNLFDSIKRSQVQTKSSNVSQNEIENLKSQLSEFADKMFDKVFQKIESMNKKKLTLEFQMISFTNLCMIMIPQMLNQNREEKIIFENETLSFETKIKELEMTLAQQTKDFEDVKVDFSKKTDKFKTYFEKLKNARVVLKRQLDRKI
uniref:Uncharacterized protein n=1 Tax=Tanacetum cinerariifolium TaxID=118510 RepID=A0A6L2NTQ2_TANCI|nr:hypothetical protein [Tanacetum cinerariifolium]